MAMYLSLIFRLDRFAVGSQDLMSTNIAQHIRAAHPLIAASLESGVVPPAVSDASVKDFTPEQENEMAAVLTLAYQQTIPAEWADVTDEELVAVQKMAFGL